MARRKTSKKKSTAGTNGKSSFRPIWAGSIDFGLVNIPVKLYSAQASSQLEFDLLDKRDFSRDISPLHYETPYYLEPLKNGRHAYALLREVLKRTGKVGIAKVVIRNRQRLAALIPQGPLLVLNILRYAHELRDASKLALPQTNGKGEVSNREIKMAEELVENMVGRWNPEKYHDEYYEDLLKLIQKKVKAGKTKVVEPAGETPRPKREGKVIDIMDLLRQSVKQTHSKEGTTRQRKAG